MDIEETKKAIEVMQAYVDGKQIQATPLSAPLDWIDTSPQNMVWNWGICNYRIKREPREWYVGVDTDGNISSVNDRRIGLPHEVIRVREVLE